MGCADCPYLAQKRIPPTIPIEAELAIVGEAPGATEVLVGQPFVGQSGRLLWGTIDRAIQAKGFSDRKAVYVTNALLCQVPRGSTVSRQAIDHCRPRLIAELKQVQPKLILSFGSVALRSLLDDDKVKITKLQGLVRPWGSSQLLPCIHPSAVLRAPANYKIFKQIVEYAVDIWYTGEVRDPGETKGWLVDNETKVQQAFAFLSKFPVGHIMAADIETTGFNPRVDQVLCIGISWEKNKVLIIPDRYIKRFGKLFEGNRFTWVWHNGKFDVAYLRQLGIQASVHEDTMLLHYMLDENQGTHDLKQLSTLLLGAPDYEADLKKFLPNSKTSYSVIPKPELYKYQAFDADYTRQCFTILKARVDADPYLKRAYNEVILPSQKLLQKIEARGIWVNKQHLDALRLHYYKKRDLMEEKVHEIIGDIWSPEEYAEATGANAKMDDFNPGSPQQLKWLLYEKMGLTPERERTHNTREKTLKKIDDRRAHGLIKALLELRKAKKILSTYIDGIEERLEPNHRVYSTYLLHGTATGRLASRNPNLQNIPRDGIVRSMFQAPPGRILMEADYRAHELRCLAYLSGDKFFRRVFEEGKDLHDEVSLAMYGPGFTKEQRIRAKALNFGIAYGREAGSIAEEFKISHNEAQELIDTWFNRFPQAHEYIMSCRRKVVTGEVLVSPFGRKRRFGLVTPDKVHEMQNESANFAIQSLASDLTLLTSARIDDTLVKRHCYIINLVHDSILVEAPDDPNLIKALAEYLVKSMRATPRMHLNTDFPFDAEVKMGREWGRLKAYEVDV